MDLVSKVLLMKADYFDASTKENFLLMAAIMLE